MRGQSRAKLHRPYVEEVPEDSRTADEPGRRISHAVTALAAFTAGVTAAATLLRRAGNRPPMTVIGTTAALPAVAPTPDHGGVVLPFARQVLTGRVPERLGSPARCGESGGRTKAGTPCGARTNTGLRCHHHPMAA